MHDDAVVLAFLERLAADRRRGSALPLAAYESLYPGFELVVADAYARAMASESASPTAPSSAYGSAADTAVRIGPYRILDELGRGGQGVVYRAVDDRIDRPVALKLLVGRALVSEDARRRFGREAAIASRLSHPNICTVFEADTEDGVPYIAMAIVGGTSLARRLAEAKAEARDGPPWVRLAGSAPPTDTVAEGSVPTPPSRSDRREEFLAILLLGERVARALHCAHEAGIVHRDVKPGNIMVTMAGEPVLMDFGLAREESSDAPLTLTGDVLGTPAYMSPEQLALGTSALDRRTDVYSLGATLYECLTLARPFEAHGREALERMIRTQDPADPRTVNRWVPRELVVVLAKAMEKDRDRRYGTAEELADDLRRVRNHEPILARAVGPFGRLIRWAHRNPAVAGTLALVFLLLAGLVGVYAWRGAQLSDALGRVSEETARTRREMERVTRLKDRRTLRVLLERAKDLYPPLPERIEAMEAWLRDAHELRRALPGHRTALAALDERAGPYTDEQKRAAHPDAWVFLQEAKARLADMPQAEAGLVPVGQVEQVLQTRKSLQESITTLETQVARRPTWSLADDEIWLHELLTELVAQLAAALEGAEGAIADVERRLERARAIGPRTLEDHAAAWDGALARVRANSRYALAAGMSPQIGLIPLGPDPESGLEEFLHWATHLPGHPLPRRGDDGRLPPMDGETGIILVLLPGGSFIMGATRNPKGPNHDPHGLRGELPPHEVVLSPFLIGKHEVTRGQWTRLSGQHDPSHFTNKTSPIQPADYGRHPVNLVSWSLCSRELHRGDLAIPTEAQWEYACRAGTDTPWSFGRVALFPRFANLADKSYARVSGAVGPHDWKLDDGHGMTAPVGSYLPNAFGLHDMHGNVAEWCQDLDAPYAGGHRPGDGLLVEAVSHDQRSHRGGCFDNVAGISRSASRGHLRQQGGRSVIGVRAARDLRP